MLMVVVVVVVADIHGAVVDGLSIWETCSRALV